MASGSGAISSSANFVSISSSCRARQSSSSHAATMCNATSASDFGRPDVEGGPGSEELEAPADGHVSSSSVPPQPARTKRKTRKIVTHARQEEVTMSCRRAEAHVGVHNIEP